MAPSPPGPGCRVIVRVTQGHNSVVATVPDYRGPLVVGPALLAAVAAEFDRRYQGAGWKEFTGVEILGRESS